MSEFGEMIKEALLGDESFDPRPGAEALQAAVRKFDRRMWTVRILTWLVVALTFALGVWMSVLLLQAPEDASPGRLLFYAVIAIVAITCVGLAKGWWFLMQNHFALMKELKKIQLMLLDRG